MMTSDGGASPKKRFPNCFRPSRRGEEIEVVINSPGGSVYEGIAIFNTLRKAAETHPVHVWINGLAASMASYIAIAGRAFDKNFKITVNENSIYFIHNPWNYSVGDYRVLRKEADYLDRLAKVSALAYSAVSQTDIEKIRSAMDEETYYIGQEIIDAGFANDFEALYSEGEKTEEDDRDVLVTQAQLKIEAVMSESRKNFKGDELEKAVALLEENFYSRGRRSAGNQSESSEGTGAPPEPVNNEKPEEEPPAGSEGGSLMMKPEELLAKDPDCYKAIMALGETAALEKERKRVNAHIKMGKQSGDLDLAAKFIQEGKSLQDDDVHADYMAAAMKNRHFSARMEDNPSLVHTEGDDNTDEAAAMKAFDLGFSGRDLEGGTSNA
jgi:ATP-dependent protease ClpP protease subunit